MGRRETPPLSDNQKENEKMTDETKSERRGKSKNEENAEIVTTALTTAVNVKKFEAALAGTGVTPARFLRQCQTVFNAVPKLASCDPYTVLGAMLGAAQMGLELEPALEEADIIPYGSEAKLMPRYGGLLKLVRQGEVTEIYAETVFENDGFHYDRGTSRRIEHTVDYRLSENERGEIVGFYAVARLARGGVEIAYMHRRDVETVMESVKKKTPADRWAYSPWNSHFVRMGEKTVLRRLCKRLPKTDRAARAMQLQAMAEAGEPLTLRADAEVRDAAPRPPSSVEELTTKLRKDAPAPAETPKATETKGPAGAGPSLADDPF